MKEEMKNTLKKSRWRILIEIAFIALNMYLLTYPPAIIGKIIDLLKDMQANRQLLIQNIVILVGISFVLLIVRLIWRYQSVIIARETEKDLKNRLFTQLMNTKLEKLQERKNGELMSYFAKDITEIRMATFRVLSFGTRIVFTLIFATWAMVANVDFKLTVMTLIPIVLTAVIIMKLQKYIESNFIKSEQSFTELSEFVQESTDAIRTTKAYAQEEYQYKEFIQKNQKVKSNDNAVDIYSNLLSTCINVCFGLCYAISILYGSNLVLNDTITLGAFIAFNSYILLFLDPVSWIPGLVSKLKRAKIAYGRLDEIFAMEKENLNIAFATTNQEITGNITIQDLTFYYPSRIEPVLENITVQVEKGETLGIIGTIGSGKTTLMNLIMRLYEVDKGKILIDGNDINDIPLEVIRNNICYITQDNFLFSTTLKENISLFKEEYEDDQIRSSTKNAMIYDEIKEMPNNIHTVIGEQGVDLSGGQKQRVVISRAFLQKSNIVIFDDTFSALDNRTEEKLLKNIKELTQNKTCIIISNRISDVKEADKIIVLENGKIIERGKHKELLEKQGKYYQFYQQQSMQTSGLD